MHGIPQASLQSVWVVPMVDWGMRMSCMADQGTERGCRHQRIFTHLAVVSGLGPAALLMQLMLKLFSTSLCSQKMSGPYAQLAGRSLSGTPEHAPL